MAAITDCGCPGWGWAQGKGKAGFLFISFGSGSVRVRAESPLVFPVCSAAPAELQEGSALGVKDLMGLERGKKIQGVLAKPPEFSEGTLDTPTLGGAQLQGRGC